MREWESFIYKDEQERNECYRKEIFPPGASVAKFWVNNDFKDKMFKDSGVKSGDHLLLISEDNVRCELTEMAEELVGSEGEVVDIDIMTEARTRRQWPIYTERCADFDDGYFDVAVATTVHHMDNLDTETSALTRVVKNGGGVLMADNGPGRLFFELCELDAHLAQYAHYFITNSAIRLGFSDDPDEAYEGFRAFGCKYGIYDLQSAVKPYLEDVYSYQWRGMWYVVGKKK